MSLLIQITCFKMSDTSEKKNKAEQDTHCACYVTLRRVCTTSVAVEKQHYIF